jgi:hypothetical protein
MTSLYACKPYACSVVSQVHTHGPLVHAFPSRSTLHWLCCLLLPSADHDLIDHVPYTAEGLRGSLLGLPLVIPGCSRGAAQECCSRFLQVRAAAEHECICQVQDNWGPHAGCLHAPLSHIIIIIIIITRHAQLKPRCCSVIKHVKSLNLNLFCPAFPVFHKCKAASSSCVQGNLLMPY